MFLVADDIMDGSITRRGKPCWYKCSDVQMDAVNDTLILESFMYYLINTFFGTHPEYTKIMQLFQYSSLETQLGQMLDLLGQPQGRKGLEILNNFNLDLHTRIVTYKTAIYSFYLPIACALYLTGHTSEKQLALARELSIELGVKFQIQDDYLDCYQTPEVNKQNHYFCFYLSLFHIRLTLVFVFLYSFFFLIVYFCR